MKEKTNNTIKIVLLIIFIFIFSIIGSFLGNKLYDKLNDETEEPKTEKKEEKDLTEDEILALINGDYLYSKDDYQGHGIYIHDKKILFYLTHSDGFIEDDIIKIEKGTNKDEYIITSHHDAYDGVESSHEEATNEYIFNISKISNGILLYNNKEYYKFTDSFTNWDAKDEFIKKNYKAQ